ncbi:hypothetical protein [Ornithinicoccus halotolerans]|uniref:hypothetical protein n=1 Tax=Ornithinicoccus halotolerans TaxID=1748220 RepID=UPI001885E62E|nr:hypothetical protein [Ornithinicoccus halotolerans]
MTHTHDPQAVALSHYTDVLRRRWWVPAVGALVGIAAALGALAIIPSTVTATSTVRVNVISNDPFNPSRTPSALLDMNGEAQLAGSHLVAEQAAAALGGDFTPAEIREGSGAVVVPETAVLRISATAAGEDRARLIADAVAEAYLETRAEQAQARIDRQVEQSRLRLEPLRGELAVINATLATAEPDSEEAVQAETDRSLLVAEINSVLDQQATTESIDTTGGAVLNPAAVASVEHDPNRTLILATGTLGGLGAGLIAAFLVHALGARVRTPGDVVRHTGRPVLGALPGRRLGLPIETADREELRVARERMLADPALRSRVGVAAVLGTSDIGALAEAAAGAALAEQVAEAGVDVLLVPLALEEGQAQSLLAALPVRHDERWPGESRRFTGGPGGRLTVLLPAIASAAEPPGPALYEQVGLESHERLVLLLVPSSASPATRLAAARLASTTVLLISRRRTRVPDLRRTVQDVREMGGQVIGTVLLPPGADPASAEGEQHHPDEEKPVAEGGQQPRNGTAKETAGFSRRARSHQPSDIRR